MCYCYYVFFSTDLSTPSTTTSGGGADLLVDVFGVEPVAPPPVTPPTGDAVSPGAEEGYNRFLTRTNGVLFENDILQIGVKSQFKKSIGTYCMCCRLFKLHCKSKDCKIHACGQPHTCNQISLNSKPKLQYVLVQAVFICLYNLKKIKTVLHVYVCSCSWIYV